VKGNEIFTKEQAKHVAPSFTLLDNKIESLQFLSISLPLTPHHVGIS
jgi:hypothetical protein